MQSWCFSSIAKQGASALGHFSDYLRSDCSKFHNKRSAKEPHKKVRLAQGCIQELMEPKTLLDASLLSSAESAKLKANIPAGQ